MTRQLDTDTLNLAAEDYATHLRLASTFSRKGNGVAIGGEEWVYQNLFNMGFADEHVYLVDRIKGELGARSLVKFEAEAAKRFSPREDSVFAALLAEKLAIDPDGNHIPGRIGSIIVGSRHVREQIVSLEHLDSIRRRRRLGIAKDVAGGRELYQQIIPLNWHVYAGEEEERADGGGAADPLPSTSLLGRLWQDESGTLVTNVSIAFAQAALDPALDLLDEGTVDGFLDGRSGTQPADPNVAITGVRLFANDLGTPGFANSTDAAPGALGTANPIADDVSADATGTLNYVRAASANTIITSLNDHIDGHADTSGGDFNFNTLAIVALATVSITSWTVTFPQGPTAT